MSTSKVSKRPFSELLDGQNNDDEDTPLHKRRAVSHPLPHLTLSLPARDARPPRPPPFQQPVQLLSFSYTSKPEPSPATSPDAHPAPARKRTLEWNNASLRYYVPPPPGADLAHAFARWIRRPETRPRLDGLLSACLRPECRAAQARAGIVAWRGVMTKILTAPYEGREGWTLNVMRVKGVMYLEEHLTTEQLRAKMELDKKHLMMTYYGYAFEAYCTAEKPGGRGGWGGDVDTNVQWCSVVKTKLGDVRLLMGGEVDCVRDRYTGQPETFVELKTSLALRPGNRGDSAKFERKLLKFHIQSFLLGVPEIIVGFRTLTGRLQAVQTFRTLDLPRLARDEWDAGACLAWGKSVCDFLRGAIEDTSDEEVWRATFTPGEGVVMQKLEEEEIQDVRGNEEDRVGFLPRWYWDAVREERAGQGEDGVGGTTSGKPVAGWQL